METESVGGRGYENFKRSASNQRTQGSGFDPRFFEDSDSFVVVVAATSAVVVLCPSLDEYYTFLLLLLSSKFTFFDYLFNSPSEEEQSKHRYTSYLIPHPLNWDDE